MTVKTTAKKQVPALTYDHVRISRFVLNQPDSGVKQVESTAKMYAVGFKQAVYFNNWSKFIKRDYSLYALPEYSYI